MWLWDADRPGVGLMPCRRFDPTCACSQVYTIVVNKILAPYGKEQTWEIKSRLMGTPERRATEILLEALWPPTDSERAEGRLFASECPFTIDSFLADRNMSLDDYFSKVKPMPGAERLVAHLAKHNVPMAVATGSKRRNCEEYREASQWQSRAAD